MEHDHDSKQDTQDNTPLPVPGGSFYRILFAVLCFSFFLAGIKTSSPFAFLVAVICGALYLTAKKKGWPDPF